MWFRENQAAFLPGRESIKPIFVSWSIFGKDTRSVDGRPLSSLIWKRDSNYSILWLRGAASGWKMCQRNSFPLSNLIIQAPEIEFASTSLFQPSTSQEVVFAGVAYIQLPFSAMQEKWS